MGREILRDPDGSINVVEKQSDGGFIESRYVRRTQDTVILYVSSATGCALACRFCHLTQTKQTMSTYVDHIGYTEQISFLLSLLTDENKIGPATFVHINFMARGDALDNPILVSDCDAIFQSIRGVCQIYGLTPKFKLSTIFPKTMALTRSEYELKEWVKERLEQNSDLEFYYSFYSTDPAFRKRWIPKGIDIDLVGRLFEGTTNRVRIHHALIAEQNDNHWDAISIKHWLARHDIRAGVNIVRYNPFSSACGEEAPQSFIDEYCDFLNMSPLITSIQVVSKIGFSVKASCGMFVK